MTKEEIQSNIDHYHAVSDAYAELGIPKGELYFQGKADAWIDLYDKLYPEMEGERAFPLDEGLFEKTKNSVIGIYKTIE